MGETVSDGEEGPVGLGWGASWMRLWGKVDCVLCSLKVGCTPSLVGELGLEPRQPAQNDNCSHEGVNSSCSLRESPNFIVLFTALHVNIF